ncbi:argininosuccinate synthase, chloroplastic-like [Miscanthus floridulus]|uniref:argininosuccinate synthase, chloroplastic-like n=1 Tax=Miscanthus floridulus TaxID=154761 RepID=UPI0034582ED3
MDGVVLWLGAMDGMGRWTAWGSALARGGAPAARGEGYLEIGIVAGVPVSINGQSLSPASLLAELNEIGWKHGIGRIDMVQNRLVGMKSRGVYKTPGGTLMAAAVRELEALTLDRETTQWKDMVALTYAELVYAGRWFDPLRQSLETIAATTTSSVTLKLYRGSASVASRKSPFSLYREDNQTDADGLGLPDDDAKQKGANDQDEDKDDGFSEVRNVFMIFGGPSACLTARQHKRERREVFSIKVATP